MAKAKIARKVSRQPIDLMSQAVLTFEAVEKFHHVSPRDLTYRLVTELWDDVAARATFDVTP